MKDIGEHLREELRDAEYSEGYAESFLDSHTATQIKVLREQHGLSQQALAELIGTKQGVISRIENVGYSKWNISTLKKLARAYRVRLKVSFETYGSLITEVREFSRESLQRVPREKDPILHGPLQVAPSSRHKRHAKRSPRGPLSNLVQMPTTGFPMAAAVTTRNSAFGTLASQLSAPTTAAELAQRIPA